MPHLHIRLKRGERAREREREREREDYILVTSDHSITPHRVSPKTHSQAFGCLPNHANQGMIRFDSVIARAATVFSSDSSMPLDKVGFLFISA
mmetsp:Transcript_18526/g.50642  ORF Transcript_18526/g.50642 Transcript_18526/m.50642 type:complete len:93 (+) Transcript_18526:160-438(+)